MCKQADIFPWLAIYTLRTNKNKKTEKSWCIDETLKLMLGEKRHGAWWEKKKARSSSRKSFYLPQSHKWVSDPEGTAPDTQVHTWIHSQLTYKRMRQAKNRTSWRTHTHVQPCRKTGRHANSPSEAGGRAGQRCSQCPRAAPDITASLNSIMTVSPTSHGPAFVWQGRLRSACENLPIFVISREDQQRSERVNVRAGDASDWSKDVRFLCLRENKFYSDDRVRLHVRIWAHELYVKTNSMELNTSMCARNATVAIVTLLEQLNHLIHSAIFSPRSYLPYTWVHMLSHVPWPVTVWVIHKEIISSGATVQTEECDSLIFWMIGWQLAT